uniref:Tripartite motif-containing protein 30A-like n=1 Tax=Peromyscus maniculatus bairdii TaxID=230844 RepID=A0A8C8W519_PERMB
MASSVLVMIQEEVTCPICLELLKEPVSADCDHSFCRACITLNYESSKVNEGEGICPVCRVSYQFGNLRPNRQLANIKDKVAICWLCERSQEHRGHQTALIEEVAQEYRGKLQATLQKLVAKEKICDEWKDDLQEERTFWKGDVEKVQMEFKELREFLDSKEKNEVQKLKQEEEDIMNSLAESESELVKQRESVRDLISDVEHQLQCSTMEMLQVRLQEVPASGSQETWKLKQPEMIPRKQRRIFRAPDLKGMLQVFQGENSYILWVTDKGEIQHRNVNRKNPQVSETYKLGVLGYPAIYSGKHYWEIDVSRSDGIKVKYNPDFKQYHVNYQPKYGYWVIGMKNGSVYNAFEECSVTHNGSVLVLSLIRRPSRVGVFLDREACTLSFYDVSNHGALIYRFCEPSFPDEVYPYFNPMSCLEPMTVCGPPS